MPKYYVKDYLAEAVEKLRTLTPGPTAASAAAAATVTSHLPRYVIPDISDDLPNQLPDISRARPRRARSRRQPWFTDPTEHSVVGKEKTRLVSVSAKPKRQCLQGQKHPRFESTREPLSYSEREKTPTPDACTQRYGTFELIPSSNPASQESISDDLLAQLCLETESGCYSSSFEEPAQQLFKDAEAADTSRDVLEKQISLLPSIPSHLKSTPTLSSLSSSQCDSQSMMNSEIGKQRSKLSGSPGRFGFEDDFEGSNTKTSSGHSFIKNKKLKTQHLETAAVEISSPKLAEKGRSIKSSNHNSFQVIEVLSDSAEEEDVTSNQDKMAAAAGSDSMRTNPSVGHQSPIEISDSPDSTDQMMSVVSDDVEKDCQCLLKTAEDQILQESAEEDLKTWLAVDKELREGTPTKNEKSNKSSGKAELDTKGLEDDLAMNEGSERRSLTDNESEKMMTLEDTEQKVEEMNKEAEMQPKIGSSVGSFEEEKYEQVPLGGELSSEMPSEDSESKRMRPKDNNKSEKSSDAQGVVSERKSMENNISESMTEKDSGLEKMPQKDRALEEMPPKCSKLEEMPQNDGELEKNPQKDGKLDVMKEQDSGLENTFQKCIELDEMQQKCSGFEKMSQKDRELGGMSQKCSELEKMSQEDIGLEEMPHNNRKLRETPQNDSGLIEMPQKDSQLEEMPPRKSGAEMPPKNNKAKALPPKKVESSKKEVETMPTKSNESEMMPSKSDRSEIMPSKSTESQMTPLNNDLEMMPSKSNESEMMPLRSNGSNMMPLKNDESEMMSLNSNESEMMPLKSNESDRMPPKNNESQMMPSNSNESEMMQSKNDESEMMPSKYDESEMMPSKNDESEMMPSKSSESEMMPSKNGEKDSGMMLSDDKESEMMPAAANLSHEIKQLTISQSDEKPQKISSIDASITGPHGELAETFIQEQTKGECSLSGQHDQARNSSKLSPRQKAVLLVSELMKNSSDHLSDKEQPPESLTPGKGACASEKPQEESVPESEALNKISETGLEPGEEIRSSDPAKPRCVVTPQSQPQLRSNLPQLPISQQHLLCNELQLPCNMTQLPCNQQLQSSQPQLPCNKPQLPCDKLPLPCNMPQLPDNQPRVPCGKPQLPCDQPQQPSQDVGTCPAKSVPVMPSMETEESENKLNTASSEPAEMMETVQERSLLESEHAGVGFKQTFKGCNSGEPQDLSREGPPASLHSVNLANLSKGGLTWGSNYKPLPAPTKTASISRLPLAAVSTNPPTVTSTSVSGEYKGAPVCRRDALDRFISLGAPEVLVELSTAYTGTAARTTAKTEDIQPKVKVKVTDKVTMPAERFEATQPEHPIPTLRDRKKKKKPKCKIVRGQLSEPFQEVLKSLRDAAAPSLAYLRQQGLLPVNQDFVAFSPDITRFIVKQQEKESRDAGEEADKAYQSAVELHCLVSAADVLVHCCLQSTIVQLAVLHSKHAAIIKDVDQLEMIREELRRLWFQHQQRKILHPKMSSMCDCMVEWLFKKKLKSPEGDPKMLIICKRDLDSLLKCLRDAVSVLEGADPLILPADSPTTYQHIMTQLEHSHCLILRARQIREDFPWAHFALVVEYEYTDHNATWRQLCDRQHIRFLGLQTVVKQMSQSQVSSQQISAMLSKPSSAPKPPVIGKFILIGAQQLTPNKELLLLLETRHSITVVERDYSKVSSPDITPLHFADIVVDEKTCILLVDRTDLTPGEQWEKLQQRLVAMSLKYSACWVVLCLASSSAAAATASRGNKQQYMYSGQVPIHIARLHGLAARLSGSGHNFTVQVVPASTDEQTVSMIRQIAEDTCRSSTTCSKDDWMSREWLDAGLSRAEQFLLTLPCLNSFSAQMLLKQNSVPSLLQMLPSDLLRTYPRLPPKVVKLFWQLTHQRPENNDETGALTTGTPKPSMEGSPLKTQLQPVHPSPRQLRKPPSLPAVDRPGLCSRRDTEEASMNSGQAYTDTDHTLEHQPFSTGLDIASPVADFEPLSQSQDKPNEFVMAVRFSSDLETHCEDNPEEPDDEDEAEVSSSRGDLDSGPSTLLDPVSRIQMMARSSRTQPAGTAYRGSSLTVVPPSGIPTAHCPSAKPRPRLPAGKGSQDAETERQYMQQFQKQGDRHQEINGGWDRLPYQLEEPMTQRSMTPDYRSYQNIQRLRLWSEFDGSKTKPAETQPRRKATEPKAATGELSEFATTSRHFSTSSRKRPQLQDRPEWASFSSGPNHVSSYSHPKPSSPHSSSYRQQYDGTTSSCRTPVAPITPRVRKPLQALVSGTDCSSVVKDTDASVQAALREPGEENMRMGNYKRCSMVAHTTDPAESPPMDLDWDEDTVSYLTGDAVVPYSYPADRSMDQGTGSLFPRTSQTVSLEPTKGRRLVFEKIPGLRTGQTRLSFV